MFVGSLMIATQAVCGGMLSRSISVITGRSLGLCAITADPRVRRPYHCAYHTYLGLFGI